MPDIVSTSKGKAVANIARMREQFRKQYLYDAVSNAVPELEDGVFTGRFYDKRYGPPVDKEQPDPARLQAYLADFMRRNEGKSGLVPQQQIPGFNIHDPYQSEGLLSSLSNMMKAGYSGSLLGLAEEAVTGEEPSFLGAIDREKIAQWRPEKWEQIGTGLAGFIPDLPIFAGLEIGTGGFATPAIAMRIGQVGTRMLRTATVLGSYEGARGFFEGVADPDKNTLVEMTKGFGKGATLGALLGGVGAAIPAGKTAMGKVASEVSRYGAEVFTLGTVSPFLEGETPTSDDILSAASFLAMLRLGRGAGVVLPKAFNRAKIGNAEKMNKRIQTGEEPNKVLKDMEREIFESQPERYNTKILAKIDVAKSGETVGKLGDFFIGKDVARRYKGTEDIPIKISDKVPREFKDVTEGEAIAGWFGRDADGKMKMFIHPKYRDFAGGTIVHEATHAKRFIRGRKVERTPEQEARAEKFAEFIKTTKEPRIEKTVAGRKISEVELASGRKYWFLEDVPKGKTAKRQLAKILAAAKKEKVRPYVSGKSADTKHFKELQEAGYIGKKGHAGGKRYVITEPKEVAKPIAISEPKPPEVVEPKPVTPVKKVVKKMPKKIVIAEKEIAMKKGIEKRMAEKIEQPWKMMRKEFIKSEIERLKPKPSTIPAGRRYGDKHENIVTEAFNKGRPIPKSVLKDYPELQAKKSPKDISGPVARRISIKIAEDIHPETGSKTRTLLSKSPLRWMISAEARLNSPTAKEGAGMVRSAYEHYAPMLAKYNIWMEDLGLTKLVPKLRQQLFSPAARRRLDKESALLYDQISKGQHPGWRRFFEDLHREITKRKPNVGKIQNYITQALQEDIAKTVYKDLSKIAAEVQTISGKAEIETAIRRSLATKSSETRAIIDHVTKGGLTTTRVVKGVRKHAKVVGREGSLQSTILKLKESIGSQLLLEPGVLKKRTFEYPDKYLEKDVRILIPRYVMGVTRWMAAWDKFGAYGNKVNALLKKLMIDNPEEANVLAKAVSMWTGAFEREHSLTGQVGTAVDAFTGFQVATKIGMGQATALNLSQPFLAIIPDMGIWNTVSGGLKLLDPAFRGKVTSSGVINNQAIHAIAGFKPAGLMGKISDIFTKISGFEGINKGLQFLSAATAEVGIKKLHRQAQGKGIMAEWARKRLADFKINPDQPISDSKLLKAMYRFATDTQLQKNVLADPLLMNDPRWRHLAIFKRFGFRQTKVIKDILVRETIQRKNPMPLIRLALGGYFAGAGSAWALNKVKSMLSGEPYYDEEDSFAGEMLNNLANIGALGMMGDVIGRLDDPTSVMKALRFAAEPVLLADTYKIIGGVTKFMEDWNKYGDGFLALRKNTYTLMGPIGTYPRTFLKRLQAPGQKEARISYKKSHIEKPRIFKLLLEGDGEQAGERVAAWNNAYPNNPIQMQDVSVSALMDWIERRAEAYAKQKVGEESKLFGRIAAERRKKLIKELRENRGTFTELRKAIGK